MKELITIQSKLKAPKNQHNKFGNYNYRSAEDILEAVKPLLTETGCVLTISDEIVQIGERYYVKATARVRKDSQSVETVAYAREEESKKGMDGAQVTGSASSYARKYALNGLFCIDDNKDPDTNEHAARTREKGEPLECWRDKVVQYCHENNIDMNELAKDYKLNSSTTDERFKGVYEHLTGGQNAGRN